MSKQKKNIRFSGYYMVESTKEIYKITNLEVNNSAITFGLVDPLGI